MAEPPRIDLVQYDRAPNLRLHVIRDHPTAGPTAVDLTGASAVWRMRFVGSVAGGSMGFAVVGTSPSGMASSGVVDIFFAGGTAGNLATAGKYHGQLTCALADGSIQTAPSEEPFVVVIHARI